MYCMKDFDKSFMLKNQRNKLEKKSFIFTNSNKRGLQATTNGKFRKSSIRCAKRIGKSL